MVYTGCGLFRPDLLQHLTTLTNISSIIVSGGGASEGDVGLSLNVPWQKLQLLQKLMIDSASVAFGDDSLQLLQLQHLKSVVLDDVQFDDAISAASFSRLMFELGKLHPKARLSVDVSHDRPHDFYCVDIFFKT